MYEDGVSSHTNSTGEMLTYVDKVGGRWNRGVQLPDPSQLGAEKGEILIDQNNLPEISYTIGAIYSVNAGIGNANKATSFTTQAVASNFTGQPGIAMDNANNTWISYSTSSSGAFPMPAVVEHRTGDPWSTWQTPITDSVPNGSARTAALAINGSTLYIAYEAAWGPTSNVVWQSTTAPHGQRLRAWISLPQPPYSSGLNTLITVGPAKSTSSLRTPLVLTGIRSPTPFLAYRRVRHYSGHL